MSMDADSGFAWNRVMAVSLISIIPSLVVFFLAQRQFMDGRDGRRRQGLTPDFSPIRWRVSVDRGALFPYEIGNGGLPG